ncbi:PAS domain-containing protein [Methylobacterium oryzisoli]|uniref:PAS domain-containing protein n=1 Tax=Methylobacterium oryzisoli TaxID=3385502 RepID=UPI0038913759
MPWNAGDESGAGAGMVDPDHDRGAGHVPAELRALNATLASAVFAPDGRILRANNRLLRWFGYELGEIVRRSHADLCHPDDRDREEAGRFWAALLGGRRCTVSCRRLRADGTEIWLRASYAPLAGPDGIVEEIVMLASDITGAQREEAADRVQIAAINASQAVIHFSLDGTILDANPLFLTVTGYARGEVVGRHHRMFLDPAESESAAYRAFWARLAQGEYQAGEFRRLARDGREIWLQATYTPVLDPAGRPFKVIKFATDVTAERLRQAAYQWQVAAIHKSHCILTLDMHGVIVEANDRFLEAMGYRMEEIEGRHHRILVEPSAAHGADYAAFWRALTQGRPRAGDYRCVGRGGREVWLQASYNPIFDMSGRPIRIMAYAVPITDEKLRQAEQQGQIAAIHKAQCVIAFSLDGTILDANDNFLRATGYRLADLRGRHHSLFVEPDHAGSAAYGTFWENLAAGQYQAGEFKRLAKDGREIWLQASYNPILDMNGRPTKIVTYATDVTREKLRQADHEAQIAAIRKSQGVVLLGLDGTILDVNAGFLATLGYRLDEICGRHHRVLVEPALAGSAAYAAFWDTLRAGAYVSGMYKRLGRDGREIWIRASYNPILDPEGRPTKVIKFATDVTADVAMAEAYEDAKRQAQHDAATALPNRVRLASFLAAMLAPPAARLAVLYLDLDRFKPVNDTYGHPVGDRVLGEIADRLRRMLRPDQIVARVGGDEFVVAAPDLADHEIEAFCQHILGLVAQPVRCEDTEIRVDVSIGVAVSPLDGTTPDDLLRSADTALLRAKQEGRGTYGFFAAEMNDRLVAHRALTDDMRRGLAAGEFFLEYQPRFDTRRQTIRSVEALVRWSHPERGRIGPAEFIPLAERSGLIVALGGWVMRTACAAAAAWPGIGVSVNVSPIQFRDDGLVDVVAQALAAASLAPERLEIEITEGVLLEDADRARRLLDGLKALGVKLAMDDFGTGYSSLIYLRSFPFDAIKIDRRFVADIERHESGRAVVQAILALGRALGLSVTAEGVETIGQLTALTVDQCNEVQGFLLAKPMPAGHISAMLSQAGAKPANGAAGQGPQPPVRAA